MLPTSAKMLIENIRRKKVTGFKHHWTTKFIAFFLALGLLWGGQSIFPQETGLEGLFKWAIKNYLDGKYMEAAKDLELLLSHCDEDHKELKGKIHLLLGAVHEQLGNVPEARKNYQLSLEFLKTPSIEGVDLTFLEEYQRIIMKTEEPLEPGIIEKPKVKPVKRKPAALLLVLGGVVIAGVAALLVMKKDKPAIIDKYTLTTNIAGQGNIILSPPEGRYEQGTPVTLTARPDLGWQFNGWSGDISSMENPITIIINSDMYVTANFTEPNPGYYSLTVVIEGQGNVTLDPPGGIYLPGTMVSLRAAPASGWEFYRWYGDLSVSENQANIFMNSHKSATAVFLDASGSSKIVGHILVFSSISIHQSRAAMPFTMPEDGAIHSITMYHLAGTGRMILAVYDGEVTPQNRLSQTPETNVNSSDGWQTINLTSPVSIRRGQTFWLAWVYESNPGIAYETGTPNGVYSRSSWGVGMPEQFGTCYLYNRICSIYATYTPD
jgi:hypothetical protein